MVLRMTALCGLCQYSREVDEVQILYIHSVHAAAYTVRKHVSTTFLCLGPALYTLTVAQQSKRQLGPLQRTWRSSSGRHATFSARMLEAKKSVSMPGFSGASSVRPASSRNPRSKSELTHPPASLAGTERSACLEHTAALCQHERLYLGAQASAQRDLDLLSCPSQLSKSGHPTLKPGKRHTLRGLPVC